MKFFKIDMFLSSISVLLVIFIVPFFLQFNIFDPIKNALLDINITDLYFSKLLDKNLPKETDLVIVNLSETSLLHGLRELNEIEIIQTLSIINQLNPTTVGIDHIFKRDTSSADFNIMADAITKNVLVNTKNLILSVEMSDFDKETNTFKKITKSDDFYSEGASIGFINLTTDLDKNSSTIRNFTPKINFKGKEIQHFAVKLASKYNPDAVERFFQRKYEKETINYKGNTNVFKIVDAGDILNNKFNPDDFKNKIVMMGVVDSLNQSNRISRLFFTPLNDRIAGKTFPDMYASIIYGNIISMIIDDNFYDTMPIWAILLISFIFCYINMMIFYNIKIFNPNWFEIGSLLLFYVESIILLTLTFQFFLKYKYEMKLTLTLITCALSVVIFEFYFSSIKPFALLILSKLFPNKFAAITEID